MHKLFASQTRSARIEIKAGLVYNMSRMNKKLVFIFVFAVFFGQCKNSAANKNAKDAVDQAAVDENKVMLTIGSISLTNRDLKNFIQLQYADIFSQKNNDKLLSRLFDVFCEQQIILFKAEQADVQVSESEVADYLKEIQIPAPGSERG